jgi:hypothetical protein
VDRHLSGPNRIDTASIQTAESQTAGRHPAGHELAIAVTEWHKRIPDYELATADQLYERGGQLSIDRLPLRWAV